MQNSNRNWVIYSSFAYFRCGCCCCCSIRLWCYKLVFAPAAVENYYSNCNESIWHLCRSCRSFAASSVSNMRPTKSFDKIGNLNIFEAQNDNWCGRSTSASNKLGNLFCLFHLKFDILFKCEKKMKCKKLLVRCVVGVCERKFFVRHDTELGWLHQNLLNFHFLQQQKIEFSARLTEQYVVARPSTATHARRAHTDAKKCLFRFFNYGLISETGVE